MKKFLCGLFISLPFLFVVQAFAQPAISVAPASFSVTIGNCNDSVTVPLVITNTGTSTLNFNLYDHQTTFMKLYAGNEDIDNISPFDIPTNTFTGSTFGTGDSPWRMGISPKGDRLYVSNRYSNNVSVYNTLNNALLATIPVGTFPAGLCFSPDGMYCFVTNRNSNSISKINCSTYSVVATYSSGMNRPHDIAITPDGSKLYVTNKDGDNVTVHNAGTGAVLTTITGIMQPHDVVMHPDGRYVYVGEAAFNTDNVVVINTTTNTVVTSIGTFDQAHGLDITPNGKYIYALDKWNAWVQVIQTSTNTVVDTIIDGRFSNGWDLVISPKGDYAYVSNKWNTPNFIILDLSNNTILSSTNTSGGSSSYPAGLACLNSWAFWLNESASSGSLPASGSTTVNVEFNSLGFVGGTYTGVIYINSNDPVNPSVAVPCTMTVAGIPNINVPLANSCPKFDTIMVNASDVDTFDIQNLACGLLNITNVLTSNTADFNIISYPSSLNGFSSGQLIIEFNPASTGNKTTTITVQNNDADTTFCLQGFADPAPVVGVTPTSFNIVINSCNDSVTQPLTINNTGGGPLNYTIATGPSVTGSKLYDGFETGNYAGWTTGTGSYTRTVTTTNPANGLYSFQLIGGNYNYYDGLYHTFTNSTPNYVSYKFMSPVGSSNWNCGVVVGRTSDIMTNNGLADSWIDNNAMQIYLYTSSGNYNIPVVQGQWYHIEYRNINFTTKTFDYYVDGTLVGANLTFWNTAITSIDVIHFMGWDPGQTSNYDEVMIGNFNSNWLYPSPLSGTSPAFGSSVVNLKFKSTNVVDGTYYANVLVNSNDPVTPQVAVPCTLTVNGTPNINVLLPGACSKFDTIFSGASDQDTFLVQNLGCDTLFISGVTSSSTHFVVNSFPAKINPYSTNTVLITFQPTTVASHSTTITIQNSDADTAFCLQGVSLAPPVITWSPASFSVTVPCAGVSVQTFSVTNTGGSDLHINIYDNSCPPPIFADNFESGTISQWTQGSCGFAYTVLTAPSPQGNKHLRMVGGCGSHYQGLRKNLGTPKTPSYAGVYVKSDNNTTYQGYFLLGDGSGNVIAWFYMRTDGTMGLAGGPVSSYVPYSPNTWYHIEYRNINFTTQTLDFYVNNTLIYANYPFRNYLTGITTIDLYNFNSSTSYYDDVIVGSCSGSSWMTIAPPLTDTIIPSVTTTYTVNFNAAGLLNGIYTNSITITSNDPATPIVNIPCTLNVVGTADFKFISLEDTIAPLCLDLDSIMEYTTSIDTIRFTNRGCDTLWLDSLKFTPAEFSSYYNPPYVLPDDTILLIVQFAPTLAGSYSGTLSLYTNDLDTVFCLKGKSFARPVLSFVPPSYTVTLNCADTLTDTLEIHNSGNQNLYYHIPYKSLDLDGTGDWVTTPLNINQATGAPGATFEAWVYPTSTSAGNHHVISTENGGVDWSLLRNGTTWYVYTGEANRSTGLPVTLNQWQHIAAVFTPGYGVRFYKNGVLANIPYIAYDAADNNVNIGRNPAAGGTEFQGKIDEVRIWNYPRTQAQIVASMNTKLSGTQSGLLGSWNFDNGTAKDVSGNSNNGTFTGNASASRPDALYAMPNWMSINNVSDTVAFNDSSVVAFTLISTGLTQGTYTVSLPVYSNDPLSNPELFPITMNVIGVAEAELTLLDSIGNCLDLDSIMEYTTSVDTIMVVNTGCDTLFIDSILYSNPAFTTLQASSFILTGDTGGIVVQFAPVSTGTITGTATVYTNDTDPVICLYGEAFARPVICWNPDTFDVTLTCCDSVTLPLGICNTAGGSPLTFEILGSGYGLVGDSSVLVIQESPAWGITMSTFLQSNFGITPVVINSSQIAAHNFMQYDLIITVGDESNAYYNTISTNVAKFEAFVNAGGMVQYQMATQGGTNVSLVGGAKMMYGNQQNQNTGLIPTHPILSGISNPLNGNSANHCYVTSLPGNAVVISTTATGGYNTTVEYTYGNGFVLATGMTWEYLYNNGYNSGPMLPKSIAYMLSKVGAIPPWLSINPLVDTVAVGDTNFVNVQFNACGLLAGVYNTNLIIESNDPLSSPDTIPVTLTVAGTADFTLAALGDTIAPLCLNLDSIMESTTSIDSVFIANTGCDTLFLDSIICSPSAFSVTLYDPYILPGDTGGFIVQFAPATTNTFVGTAAVYTNDLDTVICLRGVSYPKPVQCHSPNSYYEHFLVCQDSLLDTLEICNTGAGNLNYNLWSPYGRSARFDGSGDYINRNVTTLPTGSVMTVEAWIKPISYPDPTYTGIVSFGGRFCNGNAMVLSIQSNGRPSMATWCWDFVPGTGPTATLNQWNHIACVLNGTSVTLYMNGSPISGTLGGVPTVDPNNLAIGATDYPGRYFNGNIDEVRIYNRALTAAEIQATMHNTLAGNEPGLMGYWNFDDSTAIDKSVNTNDGTMNGNTYITVPNISFVPLAASTGTVTPASTYSVQVKFKKAGFAPGIYNNLPIYLNSNDPLNALDTVNVTFEIDALPPSPTAGSNSPICDGDNLSLTASTITGATYSWTGPNSFTSTLQNPVITAASTAASGTYSVTASVTGCPPGAPGTVTVTVNPAPPTPVAASNSTVCSGQTLSLTATTIAGASYAWTGPNSFTSSLQNPTIAGVTTLASGTYSVTATVPGCPATAAGTTTVTINQTPAAPVASSNTPVCAGNDLSLTATATGAAYSWTGPNSFTSTSQNPVISAAGTAATGTYSVTATTLGCTSAVGTTTAVVSPPPPAPTAGSNSTVCSGQILSLTASTIASATYSWMGPNSFTSTLQNPTIAAVTTLATGTYSVTATVPGCPTGPAGTTSVVINQTPVSPSASSNTPVCVGNDLSLTASTIAGVTYSWTGPNSFTNTNQNPVITAAGTAASGTYSVTSTELGCTSPAGITSVTVNPAPVAPVAGSNSTVCSGNTLSLTASTIASAVYAWSGPNSYTASVQNPTLAGVATSDAGTYSVTATVPGCPTSPAGTVTVAINQTPVAPTAGSNSPVCSGNTLSLTASTMAGASYAWSGPVAFTSTLQDPIRAAVTTAMAGTYSVTATVGGCPSPAGTTSVTIYQTPAAPSASSNSPICTGFTLSLTAGTVSGATYAWSGPNSFTDATQNPTIAGVSSANAGTYSVTVTVNGCTGPAGTTTVIVNSVPTSPSAGSNSPVCSGQTLSLNATTVGGASYSWSGPNSFSSTVQNPNIASVTTLASGTYSVSAVVAGCPPSAPGTTSVVINQTPSAPLAGSNTPVCAGNALSLTAGTIAGATYTWAGPNSFTDATQNPVIASVGTVDAGTYSVFATVSGCSGSVGTTSVVVNPPPASPTATNNSTICSGQVLSLSASTVAGATYSWTGPNSFTSTLQNPTIPGVTTAANGTYSVSSIAGGCPPSAPGTTTVTINQTPGAPVANSNSPICVGYTLSLTASSAGTTYSWTGPAAFTSTLQDPTVASVTTANGGTYSVTATTLGCTGPAGTASVVVNTIPAAPTASNQSACVGGTIPDLSATGSNIQWYDVSMTLVFSGNPFATGQTAAGTYTYYVSQTVNGCTSPTASVTLTINALPAAPNAGSDISICYGTPTPDLTATGTSIQWYNTSGTLVGTGSPYATGLTVPGSYTFIATQTNTVTTCESLGDTVVLTINSTAPPVAPDQAVCFGNPVPDLTATGTNIQWYNSSHVFVFSGSPYATGQTAVGTYTYFVTQTNTVTTCVSPEDTVYLVISTQPTVAPVVANQVACAGTAIPSLTATTGTIINWYNDGALANLVFTGNPFATGQTTAGTYTYFATDSTPGCPEGPSDTITLTINPQPATPVVSDTAACSGSTVPDLIFNGTGVQWYNSSMTLVFSGDTFATGQTAVGTYTYYVSQTNTVTTCESAKDTVLLQINPLPAVPSGLDTAVCSAAIIPNLTATGTNVQWYDSSMTLVGSGNSYATLQTAAGSYTYYVTQSDASTGCESNPDTSILTIMLSPPVPTANNVAVCFGNPVPPLTSTGTNVMWYSNASLTTLVNTGNVYNTGITAIGVYTFWVTDSLTGCVSSGADSVTLTIDTLPAKPNAANVTICYGTPATLTATGSNPQWYSDATLINMVGAGSPFNTGVTAVGTYTYYVADYAAGCGNSPSDTVVLTINPNPLVTANTYSTTIVQGNSTVLTAYNAVTYLWMPGGQTTQSITAAPTVTTTYTVTGTNQYGCSNSVTILVVVNPLGVIDFGNALQNVVVFPNPAIDQFTLEFNTTLETPIDIYMTNMLGEKVRMLRSDGVQGGGLMKHQYRFDTSTLTEGVYNIEIVTDMGTVNKRVILFR